MIIATAGSAYNSRRDISLVFIAVVFALSGAGCASTKQTPQQQFTGALMRGNAAQAACIWNNMAPQERASFSRGEGIRPQVDPGTIAAQIGQHQADDTGQVGSGDQPATVDIPGE